VRDGAPVPIVGRPNAGKSSLFNALLGEDRSLVTELPGTTRDRVSESLELAGVRVVLSDTAGIREPAERVEALGIERSEAALTDSPMAIWVVDASEPLDDADTRIARRLAGKRVVVALNKQDLPRVVTRAEVDDALGRAAVAWSRCVAVSAVRAEGLEGLRQALLAALGGPTPALGLAVSNARHVAALEQAREALAQACARAREGAPGEIVAIELREALAGVGEVTGERIDADLLDRIFGRFCIGK
jgi:tRNA modification GTPase